MESIAKYYYSRIMNPQLNSETEEFKTMCERMSSAFHPRLKSGVQHGVVCGKKLVVFNPSSLHIPDIVLSWSDLGRPHMAGVDMCEGIMTPRHLPTIRELHLTPDTAEDGG